jgi:hypothetical protein
MKYIKRYILLYWSFRLIANRVRNSTCAVCYYAEVAPEHSPPPSRYHLPQFESTVKRLIYACLLLVASAPDLDVLNIDTRYLSATTQYL